MTQKDNNGGYAFPRSSGVVYQQGMTLRDYFAAKAMQGFAADATVTWVKGVEGMAEAAYNWADEILKERAK